MEKVKKYGIIIIIAILFTLFSFSVVELIKPQPKYEDFCVFENRPFYDKPLNATCPAFNGPTKEEQLECSQSEGFIEYSYDSNNCPTSYDCNTCQALYNKANRDFKLFGFIVTSIMGIVAIMFGVYSRSKEEVYEWIISGLLIGGIATIFFGTAQYFSDMGRYARPAILLVEFLLVVWIAIKVFKQEEMKKVIAKRDNSNKVKTKAKKKKN